MSRYLIGLTGSSSSLIRPIQTINGFTQNYPTIVQRPHTSWTYQSSPLDGVDARVLGSTSSLVWNAEPRLDIWSVSTFWPRGISDDEFNKIQREACCRPRLPISALHRQWTQHCRTAKDRVWTDQSLTIPVCLKKQVTLYHIWNLFETQRGRETARLASGPVPLYKQALFERKMPVNAYNFATPCHDPTDHVFRNFVSQKLTLL